MVSTYCLEVLHPCSYVPVKSEYEKARSEYVSNEGRKIPNTIKRIATFDDLFQHYFYVPPLEKYTSTVVVLRTTESKDTSKICMIVNELTNS